MFPLHQQHRLSSTLLRAKARMRNWLIGQSMLMLSLGVCSLIVYWALGLKYFYLLAMFAGIANILPIAGPHQRRCAGFSGGHPGFAPEARWRNYFLCCLFPD